MTMSNLIVTQQYFYYKTRVRTNLFFLNDSYVFVRIHKDVHT